MTAVASRHENKKIKENFEFLSQETEEGYLRRMFPLEDGEISVKHNSVGPKRYRINYYAYDKNSSRISTFRNVTICRSIYVALKRDVDGRWSHQVWDD